MKAKVDQLEVAIDPDAVLRLRATPPAGLSEVEVVGEPALRGQTLIVSLRGSATNLANEAPCNVRCIAPSRSFSYHAKLTVSGPATQKTRAFTLDVSLPIIEAGLFGRATFDLHVVPEFPTATPASVTGIQFNHPIEVVPSKTGVLLVGHPIGFTLSVGAVFKGCRVRVAISEFDEGEEGASADELCVLLELHTDADKPPRVWRVGCDEADRPDYAEVNEDDDTYEFHHTLQVFLRKDSKTKKEVWVDAFPSSPLCTAKRPRLTSFALAEVDGDPAKFFDRSPQATLRAVARRAKGGPSLGHSRLVARGAIEGLDPDWTTEVAIRLWTHRPAPWSGGEEMRVATPGTQLTGFVDNKGAFELVLLDGAELGEAELAELAGADVQLFATLKMPVTSNPGLALEDVLTYDPATFCPLGDGDLARPAPGQSDVAVAVCACTPGVVDLPLILAPVFGPIEARAIGDDLVVRARLLGGEAYWKEAAPRIEYQVAGQSGWTDGRGRIPPLPTVRGEPANPAKLVVEARFPMSGWPGHGKEVTFRASVSNLEARFRRAKPNVPVPVVTTLSCKPAVLSITTWRSTQGGAPALAIRAETRYVPTGSKTSKTLAVQLSPLAGKVDYHLALSGEGRCEPDDGSLVAWVTDPAALEQATSVRVFRAKDGGKLFGLEVEAKEDTPAPIGG